MAHSIEFRDRTRQPDAKVDEERTGPGREEDTTRTIEAETDNVAKTVTVSNTLTQRPSKPFNHVTELNKQILNSSDTPRAEAEMDHTDRQTEAKTETRRGAGREKDIMRETRETA